jgi:SAM-dependent methyltransferase
MLTAAGLEPGLRVLDIAAGTGDQSILAAQRVRPGGSVLATDVSSSMLQLAAIAARDAGLDNVTTFTADASRMDLGGERFDAAICRFGLMFVPDLEACLKRVLAALRPGARFASLVWSTEIDNPYIGLQLRLVREMNRLPSPPPSLARTVALSGAGVLVGALTAAGFLNPEVRRIDTPRVFTSVEDALAAMQGSSPATGELTRDMSDTEREHYAEELQRRLVPYRRPDGGVVLPGAALLGVGVAS